MKQVAATFLFRTAVWWLGMAAIGAVYGFVLMVASTSEPLGLSGGISLAMFSLMGAGMTTFPLALFCALLQTASLFRSQLKGVPQQNNEEKPL